MGHPALFNDQATASAYEPRPYAYYLAQTYHSALMRACGARVMKRLASDSENGGTAEHNGGPPGQGVRWSSKTARAQANAFPCATMASGVEQLNQNAQVMGADAALAVNISAAKGMQHVLFHSIVIAATIRSTCGARAACGVRGMSRSCGAGWPPWHAPARAEACLVVASPVPALPAMTCPPRPHFLLLASAGHRRVRLFPYTVHLFGVLTARICFLPLPGPCSRPTSAPRAR